jgi:hypothetical protein
MGILAFSMDFLEQKKFLSRRFSFFAQKKNYLIPFCSPFGFFS